MRLARLATALGITAAVAATPIAARAQDSGAPGSQAAPSMRWPTRAPFGTTIRCPYSYVPDGDTVNCWGSGAVGLVMLDGPKWPGYFYTVGYYYSYYAYVRHGCYEAAVYRRAYLRGA
jgi:hypothetical protein